MMAEPTAKTLIGEKIPIISSELRVFEVADFFHQHARLEFLPVVEDQKIVGIVWRKDLMDVLAGRYGRDLHQRKRIHKIMDKSPIIVNADMPLVSLSHLITEYHGEHRGDAFLIEQQGLYLGAANFFDLLRRMTELQVQSARYANPLSGLPGNVPIQQFLMNMLQQMRPFSIIYIDLDHFKAYNDHYSFDQGDDVIRMVSHILQHTAPLEARFVGHIGGDDFIVIFEDHTSYAEYCRQLLHAFSEQVADLYTLEDRQRGGIHARNRQGDAQFYPMMSLSLGVLVVASGTVDHPQRLASLATQAKKKAKMAGGNTFFVMDTELPVPLEVL